jgi:hypothetical protein
MLTILRASRDRAKGDPPSTYEAPKIETVLTPEDLEREVQYLGGTGSDHLASPP